MYFSILECHEWGANTDIMKLCTCCHIYSDDLNRIKWEIMAIKISWAIVEHDIMIHSLQHGTGGMATLLIGVRSEYNSCLFRDITEPSLSLLLHWNRHLHHYHKTQHAASILSSHCINCFLPCCLWGLLAANCLFPHLHVSRFSGLLVCMPLHPPWWHARTSTRDGAKVDRSADITFITISLPP